MRAKRAGIRGLLPIVGLVLVSASLSHASMITIDITGKVTGSSLGTIGVDSLVTGSYTYNDSAPSDVFYNVSGAYNMAYYQASDFRLSFVDGSTVTSAGASLSLADSFQPPPGYYDAYSVNTLGSPSGTGSFAGYSDVSALIMRTDATCTAFTAAVAFPSVPNPMQVLSLFPGDSSRVLGYDKETELEFSVYFEVTNLRPQAVPVPGAFLLGAIGVACTSWRLRRHKTL